MTVVLDTSVLAAVLFGEDDAVDIVDRLLRREDEFVVSSATYVEAAIVVVARRGETALERLDLLLDHLGAQIHPVDAALGRRAVRAWHRFGKGRHAAGLNYGDCFSYALAAELDAALAFKGEDFTQTDVRSALTG